MAGWNYVALTLLPLASYGRKTHWLPAAVAWLGRDGSAPNGQLNMLLSSHKLNSDFWAIPRLSIEVRDAVVALSNLTVGMKWGRASRIYYNAGSQTCLEARTFDFIGGIDIFLLKVSNIESISQYDSRAISRGDRDLDRDSCNR